MGRVVGGEREGRRRKTGRGLSICERESEQEQKQQKWLLLRETWLSASHHIHIGGKVLISVARQVIKKGMSTFAVTTRTSVCIP